MTALASILTAVDGPALPADLAALQVSGVSDDSRLIGPGDLFLAVRGAASDGHDHAASAVAAGSVAVLAERALPGIQVPVIIVEDLNRQRSAIADSVFGAPSASLTCVGVTGTNGKTSIACFVAQLSGLLGTQAGYMGTIGWGVPGSLAPAALTTESAVTVQKRLAAFRDQGLAWAVLEVSSHAL